MSPLLQSLEEPVRRWLRRFDLVVTHYSAQQALHASDEARAMLNATLDVLRALPEEHASQVLRLLVDSKSQIGQDLFVLSQTGFKRGGYFVEFGATNGIDISNSYLLEAKFGWTGILAEPARCWHAELRRNRKSIVDTRCVWAESGQRIDFNEADFAELSTIQAFNEGDEHRHLRAKGTTYAVETISLNDLLVAHGAPDRMDYLSIDTEGSEYQILSRLDFGRFRFNVITCEHNHTPMRAMIHDLLSANGYVRVLENVSRFDDWYVQPG